MRKFTNFWNSRRPDILAEGFLKSWGALVVALIAILYYASYYRCGLNMGGEGGTVGVLAMRLMDGQRPFVDTFLGYNLMWFYPVVWLFEMTGPNYIALRIYFFALCVLTGVMAYYVVRRTTGCGWFATVVALGPVLLPGMMFRNYMAFLAVLNMLTLLHAYVFEQPTARRRWIWIVAAGLALGLTYLIRIDLGVFFSVITLGLIVLYPFGPPGETWRRVRTAAGALVVSVFLFFATHAPFYIDACRRGYAEAFVGQYTGWISLVEYLAVQEIADETKRPPSPAPVAVTTTAPAVPGASPSQTMHGAPAAKPAKASSGDIDNDDYLQRRDWKDFFNTDSLYKQVFFLVTYLPIVVALLIICPFGIVFLLALVRRDFALRTKALAPLVATGSALTLFPQYFFFRPDTPHVSEFMAPFMIAMACAAWTAFHLGRPNRRSILGVWAVVLVVICATDTGLYLFHALPKASAGTAAARRKRHYDMVGANGVWVLLKHKECKEVQTLYDLISRHTKPGDYVVCYPYAPTVNFMTDRPSFEYNLYVDNAHNVSGFYQESLREFRKYRPGAIVINNRAINQTEASRFRNWAAETYQWIQKNYIYAGKFDSMELYFRPDLYEKGNVGKPTSND